MLKDKDEGGSNTEHTSDKPMQAIATNSPVTEPPHPPPKPLYKNAIENTHPEEVAEYMILSVEDPLASALAKAKKSGLPEAAARGLEKRLRTRYAETLEEIAPITKEAIEKRLSRRLDLIEGYLSDETLLGKLTDAKLKDLGVYEGIMLTKLAESRGQPSIIIKTEDSKQLDEVATALLEEIRKRGGSVELTERTAKVHTDGKLN